MLEMYQIADQESIYYGQLVMEQINQERIIHGKNGVGFQYSDKGTSNVNGSLDLDEFTDEILLDKTYNQSSIVNKIFFTNARANVALEPRSNPSDNYSDLG